MVVKFYKLIDTFTIFLVFPFLLFGLYAYLRDSPLIGAFKGISHQRVRGIRRKNEIYVSAFTIVLIPCHQMISLRTEESFYQLLKMMRPHLIYFVNYIFNNRR